MAKSVFRGGEKFKNTEHDIRVYLAHLRREEKLYKTIMADPPWPYRSPRAIVGTGGRGSMNGQANEIIQVNAANHYRLMSIDEIKAMPVHTLAETNSHLYLWSTNSFLVEAHEVARAWGFEPKTIKTWVKIKKDDPCQPSMKTGYWFRSATEHIIFAVRGSLRLNTSKAIPTVFFHPRLPHSVKPDRFFDLVEGCSPGRYLELFARRNRSKWDSHGDQISSSINIRMYQKIN